MAKNMGIQFNPEKTIFVVLNSDSLRSTEKNQRVNPYRTKKQINLKAEIKFF